VGRRLHPSPRPPHPVTRAHRLDQLPRRSRLHPAAGVNLYAHLLQLWRAPRERAWAQGNEFWPRPSFQYDTDTSVSYSKAPGYTGIIGAAAASGADYIVTVGGKAWPANRWFGAPPDPDYPNFYDLIIEISELDPWQVARVPIIGQPAGDQLKLTALSPTTG
jgi:hypothetical protein